VTHNPIDHMDSDGVPLWTRMNDCSFLSAHLTAGLLTAGWVLWAYGKGYHFESKGRWVLCAYGKGVHIMRKC